MIIKNQALIELKIKETTKNKIFDIYDDGREDVIIGWNFIDGCNNEHLGNAKIPIECNIKTEDGKKVNCPRPVRGLYQQKQFKTLVRDLEKRGIVED